MGTSCSCEESCHRPSWTDLKGRLQESAKQRRSRRCKCTDRRPNFLKIRRRTGMKKKEAQFQQCACSHHVCCQSAVQEACDVTPNIKNVCRFTVDAYFA